MAKDKQDKQNEENKEGKENKKTKLIKMIRSEEDAKGGPLTADVHEDEVENFKQHGWKIK